MITLSVIADLQFQEFPLALAVRWSLHRVLAADVSAAPEIGFVHRKLDFADIYFLVNTSNRPVHAQATFRVSGPGAAWWDPFTGEFSKAAGARTAMDLAPYESRVLVFSKDHPAERPARSGSSPIPLDLGGGWQVAFGLSGSRAMSRLHSWSSDESTKYFSGVATYEKEVTVPEWKGRQVYLNFGEGTPVAAAPEQRTGNGMRAMLESPVREAAVVYVNGKRVGSVWVPPFEIDVSSLLHAGKNTLRIDVANTAINLLAKGPLPDYSALNAKYGERFQPQDMDNLQPPPSGLVGSVRLVAR